MADRVSKVTRSKMMGAIRSKNTKPEKLVFGYLRKHGIYFQKHYQKALGSPDIALPRKKLAVFIDGEFWHGYTLEKRKDSLPGFWVQKIIRNVKRDRRYRRELRLQGWKVLRVWEHELAKKQCEATLARIGEFLTNTH